MDDLSASLKKASGADAALDARVAEAFGVPANAYSASVEACRGLARQRFPGWRLHVGYGASGLFPYAAFSRGDERAEAEAPTLPLAILRAAVNAAEMERAGAAP